MKNESTAPASGETETPPPILATETVPLLIDEEWQGAPTTHELCAALLFNRANPDAIMRNYPAIIFPAFSETRDDGRHVLRSAGKYAIHGPGTLTAFIRNASPPVGLVDKDGEIEPLEKQIRSLWAQFEDCSLARAERIYGDQLHEQRQLGPDGKLSGKPARSLEDIKTECLFRQRALNANIEPLKARAREIIEPYFKIVFSALTKELVYREMGEREQAKNYDVLFVPSYLLRCGWTLMVQLDSKNLKRETFPSSMLAALGIGMEL